MNEIPCGVCVLHAVRTGLDYNHVPSTELVGQKFGSTDQFEIHAAATTFAGTPVCWYHVDDVAKSQGM
jgi:hypothetical protein